MQPFQMVKDLRTSYETGNVQAVLDGEIEGFMKAYLLSEEWNR
jgi:peptide chain release factor 2